MKAELALICLRHDVVSMIFLCMTVILAGKAYGQLRPGFQPFVPPISFEDADQRATVVLAGLTLDEKIQLIGGENMFFIKGFDRLRMPSLYLSDATQGVHIRKDLSGQLARSTAFPCPLALTATWNPELAKQYARSIGEECRAGDIAVLLGPGMNIYRVAQNGRNFEYFGEDPFLAARMIEQYVVGVQSTGTIATLKHFLCNNNEFQRRRTNVIVDERTLHEIYLPAFEAGVNAGAMAVMTSYNQVNGEWAGQSSYVINQLLRGDLGFRWLVMSDWWSTWDPVKTITSGLDLEMPGHAIDELPMLTKMGNIFVKTAAPGLLADGRVTESDITRMAKNIVRTTIAMGLYDRPVKDEQYLERFPSHESVALQTARESIVLLRNEHAFLPLDPASHRTILLTGDYVETVARGRGSAEVEGYNIVTMLDAFAREFGSALSYRKNPGDEELSNAGAVIVSVGTDDREGTDRAFSLPEEMNERILHISKKNPNVLVIVNAGGGVQMTEWWNKVSAILYAWYPGQNGNTALAEIVSGKSTPSGKLPISIEKQFDDSPGAHYLPAGASLTTHMDDMDMAVPLNTIEYREGVFVGYRWYESKQIEPLYPFGFGLSYTTFEYSGLKVTPASFTKDVPVQVEFVVTNTGKRSGAEVAQLYVQDNSSSVPRPVKELKGFQKVVLGPGERATIRLTLIPRDFSFWDTRTHSWVAEPGEFNLLVGSSSRDIALRMPLTLKER